MLLLYWVCSSVLEFQCFLSVKISWQCPKYSAKDAVSDYEDCALFSVPFCAKGFFFFFSDLSQKLVMFMFYPWKNKSYKYMLLGLLKCWICDMYDIWCNVNLIIKINASFDVVRDALLLILAQLSGQILYSFSLKCSDYLGYLWTLLNCVHYLFVKIIIKILHLNV